MAHLECNLGGPGSSGTSQPEKGQSMSLLWLEFRVGLLPCLVTEKVEA